MRAAQLVDRYFTVESLVVDVFASSNYITGIRVQTVNLVAIVGF